MERKHMETKEKEVTVRLEAAATLLERTLSWLDERQSALTGDVEKISATVEQTRREEELAAKLAAAEAEIAEMKAAVGEKAAGEKAAFGSPVSTPPFLAGIRKTMPAATAEMLAKHGIGDGPVDVKTLDAAMIGLSLEQRIAVKAQLMRAGLLG